MLENRPFCTDAPEAAGTCVVNPDDQVGCDRLAMEACQGLPPLLPTYLFRCALAVRAAQQRVLERERRVLVGRAVRVQRGIHRPGLLHRRYVLLPRIDAALRGQVSNPFIHLSPPLPSVTFGGTVNTIFLQDDETHSLGPFEWKMYRLSPVVASLVAAHTRVNVTAIDPEGDTRLALYVGRYGAG